MSRRNLDRLWRSRIAGAVGGRRFDAQGKGYGFSMVLQEERELTIDNVAGDASSAMLAVSIADPTKKMPRGAVKAGLRYYEDYPDATRYTDNRGVVINGKDTQEHLAIWLNQRFGQGHEPFTDNWVQYSPHGIKGALAEFIPTAFFEPSITKVIFPTPGYPVIKSSMNLRGAYAIDIPLQLKNGRWIIDTDAIDEYLGKYSLSHEGLVVYVNMPHNPTGSGYTRREWKALLLWARRHNVILVVDEAYTDLRYSDETCSVLEIPKWEESCVVLQSISKGWNATGMRLAWMVAHPTMIKALRAVIDVKDSGMSGMTIAMGLECLKHQEWAEETCRQYATLHEILSQGLREVGFADAAMPEAGLCLFTRAPRSIDGNTFMNAGECAQWMRTHLRISTMHAEADGQPYIRWAVTLKPVPECNLPDEQSVIEEVVRRLQTAEFVF